MPNIGPKLGRQNKNVDATTQAQASGGSAVSYLSLTITVQYNADKLVDPNYELHASQPMLHLCTMSATSIVNMECSSSDESLQLQSVRAVHCPACL